MQTHATLPLQPSDRVRLPPHLVLVRRDDVDIQLGVDVEDAVVLADPDETLTRLLRLMDGRYRLGELTGVAARHGAADRLDTLLAALASVGVFSRPADTGPGSHSVRLIGRGTAAELLGDQLLRAGIGRLIAVDSDPTGWARRVGGREVGGGEVGGGERVQLADHWAQPSIDAADLTIVVADAYEPDRAITTELTRADHPHLLVRPRAHGAVVGPLVVPGRTSCQRCSDLRRTRSDPAWPRMLAQLCRTRAPWDRLAAEWAAALATTQVLARLAGRSVETESATLELGPVDWSWQRRTWPADPGCGCCWTPA